MLPPHATLRAALYPAALAAVRRGGDLRCLPHHEEKNARILASYAAADLVLRGRTLLLPSDDVAAVVSGITEIAA